MLNDDQAQNLRVTLATSGWNQIILPSALSRGRDALKALCLNPDERKERGGDFKNKNDDQLRQIVEESERFASIWQNELNVYDFNRRQEELQRQQNGQEPASASLTGQPEQGRM